MLMLLAYKTKCGKRSRKWKLYVGTVYHEETRMYLREAFRSDREPTDETHREYDYCVGPFKTMRGAKACVHFAWNGNPHVISVDQCEKLGAEYEAMLRTIPIYLTRRI